MIKLPLGNTPDSKKSAKILESYYRDDFICEEKKPWLTRLEKSCGPFLAVESAEEGRAEAYILDAASQIATLGLGFSPPAFMGIGHFQESWSNRTDTPHAKVLRGALESFLKRVIGWEHLAMLLCNSGAEANERALGICHARRVRERANKILAFEGSFHGRTLMSVASTWSKQKREPFQWPEARVEFCPWPTVSDGRVVFPIPENWHQTWEEAPSQKFVPSDAKGDKLLAKEVDCLLKVREQLLTGEFFAILLEPMQSEGGDRYSSNRFHLALMLMARAFEVPLLYDEVQTGFHLGREFFWHRQFDLRDRKGCELRPDFVVCSKKAQVGMVLSPHKLDLTHLEAREEFSMASLSRGLVHGVVLDQYGEDILAIEKMVKERLSHLVEHYDKFIANPRVMGLCFAFDIHPETHIEQAKAQVNEFVQRRFERGLLYYPAGERTLRFRLNLSFTKHDVDFLFEQLDCLSRIIFLSEKVPPPTTITTRGYDTNGDYLRCSTLLKRKLMGLVGDSSDDAWESLREEVRERWGAQLVRLDKKSFSRYRADIDRLQKDTYEPVRQTSIELFEQSAVSPHSLCLGLEKDEQLSAIAFSAPPSLFAGERGLGDDPCINDENALYSMDTTVRKEFKGLGMGQFLKYAQILLASEKGVKLVCGKNRDRMARTMLKLNISLGSYEREYIRGNYNDKNDHRDSFYYHCPLQWEPSPLNLSHRISAPNEDLDGAFVDVQLPSLANKICLSNFVSERFLKLLRELAAPLPPALQHIYSASGQSECVDKVAKSLWYSNKKSNRMMTFRNHFFGNGTFLARSLSGIGNGFFPVDILPQPKGDGCHNVLEKVRECLSRETYGGVWIEPVTQLGMEFTPKAFLRDLRLLCQEKGVPLIYNETASAGFVHGPSHYFLSSEPDMAPDAGFVFMGGQAGMVFCRKGIWVADKLMMISTWDGDEFSFANYHRSMQKILDNPGEYETTLEKFEKVLKSVLAEYSIEGMELCRGRGGFNGVLPVRLQNCFERVRGRYLIDPSYCQMRRFVAEYGG